MEELRQFIDASGLTNLDWRNLLLLLAGAGFAFVAIAKKTEPYVLLPIGIGIILANLPLTGLTHYGSEAGPQESGILGSCVRVCDIQMEPAAAADFPRFGSIDGFWTDHCQPEDTTPRGCGTDGGYLRPSGWHWWLGST